MSTTTPDTDLLHAFGSTPPDLEANRAGYLTERQANQLYVMTNKENYLLAIPITGILGVIWFATLKLISVVPLSYNKILIISVCGVIPTICLIGYVAFGKYRVYSDIKNGRIETIDGDVRIWSSRNFTYIAVAGKTLGYGVATNDDLRKYLQNTLKETLFRVYFVPKSKRVVSMELITP